MTTRTDNRFLVTETPEIGPRRVTPFRDRVSAQGYVRRVIARGKTAATITDASTGLVVYQTQGRDPR